MVDFDFRDYYTDQLQYTRNVGCLAIATQAATLKMQKSKEKTYQFK